MNRILILLFLLVLPVHLAWAEKTTPASQGEITLSFAPVVRQTAPAVVNVYAKRLMQARPRGDVFGDPFYRRFFGDDGSFGRPRERVQNSLGSGVIVDSRGLIVTNNHVIQGGTDIRVVLADKREFEAELLLTDPRTDLAVLRIDAGDEDLPVVSLGDSDTLEVGDLVLAIGNPFGVGQTVTSGIVSALARTQVGISDYQFFIQTDAAINPGNSGGALVAMDGSLVGINTAIFSRSGGSIGIGFAIPVNMVKTVVQSAETGNTVKRPWLGADLQDVTADLAESLGLARPEGALVAGLNPDSPLLRAGIRLGDVILAFDGRPVESARELGYRAATATIGQDVIVEYRRSGVEHETSVRMVGAPETIDRAETLIEGENPLAGLTVANLSPAVAEELGLRQAVKGVVAMGAAAAPANRFFRRGDMIVEVNGVAIDRVDTLKDVLSQGGGFWRIAVRRGNRVLRLTLGG